MTYIKHLTKIEIVGTDLIRGYYEEMMYEVHLNGPNYQALETEEGLSFVDEHNAITKTIFKELEEYLKADYETRIEMLGAEKLVKAIDNILDEYFDVVLASNCPEVDELNEALEGFLSSLKDGHLMESVEEMGKVLQDFIFYANIEKEKQAVNKMRKTTKKDFYNTLTSARVYPIGAVSIQAGYRDGKMIQPISEMIEKQKSKLEGLKTVVFYEKSFGALSSEGSELRHQKGATYYKSDTMLMVDFGYTILPYYIESFHKVVE